MQLILDRPMRAYRASNRAASFGRLEMVLHLDIVDNSDPPLRLDSRSFYTDPFSMTPILLPQKPTIDPG